MAQFSITTPGNTDVCCYHKYDSVHKKNKVYDALFTVLTEEVINDAIKKLAFGIQLPDKYSKVLLLTNYILSNDYNRGCLTNEIDFTCLVPFFNCLNIDITCFMKKLGKCCSEDLTEVECECINNIPLSLPISYITITESGIVETSDEVIFKCCTGDNTITLLGSDTYPLGITPLNVGDISNSNKAAIAFQADSILFSETTTVNYQLLICGQIVIKPIKFIALPCVESFNYLGEETIFKSVEFISGHSYTEAIVTVPFMWACCSIAEPVVTVTHDDELSSGTVSFTTTPQGNGYMSVAVFTITADVVPPYNTTYIAQITINTCGNNQITIPLNVSVPTD